MASVSGLDPYFTNIISDLMTLERRPLEILEDQRDSLSIQNGIYQDLRTDLDSLQDAAQQLISSDAFYALTPGRTSQVTTAESGDTVLTASVGSDAGVGDYEISVTQLAEAERHASAEQASSDQALGMSGTFWLGGTGTASASVTPDATVTGAGTASVTEGLTELGTMTYTVETRDNGGVLEFRIKDADSQLVSVADQDGDEGSTTTAWQTVNTGTFDTGRGLTIDLDAAGSAGTTAVDYTAAGTSISVSTSDSLLDVADRINQAEQPDGRAVSATVVGTQLVLSAQETGTTHTMIYSDGVGFGFSELQSARDASFTVNDIAFSRASNTINDVINDVTFELAADAEGKTASLSVLSELSGAQQAVEDFIGQFNKVTSYIATKTSVTKIAENEYARGPLAGENIFSDLRSDLLQDLMSGVSNDGQYTYLREIGLTITESLQASISDPDLFQDALENHFSDVGALLDSVFSQIDDRLSRFTGTDSYMDSAIDNLGSQLSDINADITAMEEKLDDKELYLYNTYAELQSQLALMQYTQTMMSGVSNSINRFI